MTKDEALDLALEALEVIPESGSMLGAHAEEKRVKAITSIKQALEQPVQEPAVPDAINDNSESPEYREGWNDCREFMLGRGK